MQKRKAWFHWIDAATRDTSVDATVASLQVSNDAKGIDGLRKTVKAEFSSVLANVDAVYVIRDAYYDENGQSLNPRSMLDAVDVQEKLVAAVRQRQIRNTGSGSNQSQLENLTEHA